MISLPKCSAIDESFLTGKKRFLSSPPSPVLDLPPIRFIAIAKVAWASVEIDPNDIAPVTNLFTISLADSTSSRLIAVFFLKLKRPLKVLCFLVWSFINCAYSLYVSYWFVLVACCSFEIDSGFHICSSPLILKAYSPPASSVFINTGSSPNAF